MLMNLNGRERTQDAFEAIFASVTPKLRLQKVHHPEQGELSLIEVTLDGVSSGGDGADGIPNGTNGIHGNGVNGVHVNGETHGVDGKERTAVSNAVAQNDGTEVASEIQVEGGVGVDGKKLAH